MPGTFLLKWKMTLICTDKDDCFDKSKFKLFRPVTIAALDVYLTKITQALNDNSLR